MSARRTDGGNCKDSDCLIAPVLRFFSPCGQRLSVLFLHWRLYGYLDFSPPNMFITYQHSMHTPLLFHGSSCLPLKLSQLRMSLCLATLPQRTYRRSLAYVVGPHHCRALPCRSILASARSGICTMALRSASGPPKGPSVQPCTASHVLPPPQRCSSSCTQVHSTTT
jgi:hypothetical protein